MDFFKNFTLTPLNVLKAVGLFVVSLFALVFVVSLIKPVLNGIAPLGISTRSFPPSYSGYSEGVAYDSGSFAAPDIAVYKGGSVGVLSSRNIAPSPTLPGGTGNNLEDFEVKDYNATIETRNKARDCALLMDLKVLDYVVFESVNESDTSCYFSFKVKHSNVEEVLGKIKAFNPKNLSENSYTIKKQIDDFTSEQEILEKKISSINKTLDGALRSYDEITALATRTEDVATLAKIIDSKIQVIQRLTQESIDANAQLERLGRSKAEQLDRVDYTYFSINVYENKYIDWKNIGDSWKSAIKNFFYVINNSLQNASLNVLVFIFSLLPYLIYLLILVFVAKHLWKITKNIWQK